MNHIDEFLFEMGELKRVARSGWWLVGIKDPESVAEHSFRTAVIGYVLAGLEHADQDKCAVMCLFHDMQEARINDLHKVAKRYMGTDAIETRIFEDQLKDLPNDVSRPVSAYLHEMMDGQSIEAVISHDADSLECLIHALEYQALGCQDVQDWIDTSLSKLQTSSAKKIAKECIEGKGRLWWKELKKRE